MSEKVAVIDPSQIVDCWSDDERMNFLFSAFPPMRSVNPHHWDTKMSFWKDLILEISARNSHGYITWTNLFGQLTRNGKQPLGLQVVFEELVQSQVLVPTMQYSQDIRADETWIGWGIKWCVKKPVGWMADKVLSPIKSSPHKTLRKGQFVLIPALDRKCEKVVSRFHDYISQNKSDNYEFLSIISYSKLQDIVKDILSDVESVDLALATLRKNKMIETWSPSESANSTSTKVESSGEKLIKFAKIGEKRAMPFSEADIGIMKLYQTKSHLHELIDKAYQEIENCTQKARTCLKSNQQTMAKNALRKKKRIEATLEKKEQCLNNVEQLLESLHQCQTDKLVMETYKAAITAYKGVSNGISPEEAQSTMDDVANVLDTHADVAEALSGPLSQSDGEDMRDLEEELAMLLEPHQQTNGIDDICGKMENVKINGDSNDLAEVPNHSPKSVSNVKEKERTAPKSNLLSAS